MAPGPSVTTASCSGWPDALVDVASEVPTKNLLALQAPTDSAALWVVLQHLLTEHEPEKALRMLVARVEESSPGPRLNLLLGDGTTLYATTLYHSLSVLKTDDSVLVASNRSMTIPHGLRYRTENS